MPAVTNAQEPDANGYYYHDTFENGTDDWEGRGSASVSVGGTAYAGSKALTVSDRGSAWHGAQKALDSQNFKAGEKFSFSAAVSGSGNMMLSLQYTDSSGKTAYGHIANGQSSGDYTVLSNTDYQLPEGSGYILYVETEDGTASFLIDEVIIAKAGTQPDAPQSVNVIQGDFNGDERVDIFDLVLARKSLVSYTSGSATDTVMTVADIDCDGEFAVNDIVMLSKFILGKVKEFPEPIVTTTTTTAPPVTTTTTSNADPSAYMASIRDKITVNVPQNVLKNAEGAYLFG